MATAATVASTTHAADATQLRPQPSDTFDNDPSDDDIDITARTDIGSNRRGDWQEASHGFSLVGDAAQCRPPLHPQHSS